MDREWNDSQPIYRQLRDRVVAMILDGLLKEGDPLPSVRSVAAEYRVNHLTVLKGYQQLVDEQLVESKRGRGMFINAGARSLLLRAERQKFLAEEWPRIHATIQRLGLKAHDLLAQDLPVKELLSNDLPVKDPLDAVSGDDRRSVPEAAEPQTQASKTEVEES
jgi:DNA-binding transcriptional regulator YhcF (GntR family)